MRQIKWMKKKMNTEMKGISNPFFVWIEHPDNKKVSGHRSINVNAVRVFLYDSIRSSL